MFIYLVREPDNPHDPNAVAVLAPWGVRLGYLRAPLAAMLTARCVAGENFAARIAAVLGPDADPNEHLHIEVWREVYPVKVCFMVREPPISETSGSKQGREG